METLKVCKEPPTHPCQHSPPPQVTLDSNLACPLWAGSHPDTQTLQVQHQQSTHKIFPRCRYSQRSWPRAYNHQVEAELGKRAHTQLVNECSPQSSQLAESLWIDSWPKGVKLGSASWASFFFFFFFLTRTLTFFFLYWVSQILQTLQNKSIDNDSTKTKLWEIWTESPGRGRYHMRQRTVVIPFSSIQTPFEFCSQLCSGHSSVSVILFSLREAKSKLLLLSIDSISSFIKHYSDRASPPSDLDRI